MMSILAIPHVTGEPEAPEPSVRRTSARGRSDDTSPFASIFAQMQSSPQRPDAVETPRTNDDGVEPASARSVSGSAPVAQDDGLHQVENGASETDAVASDSGAEASTSTSEAKTEPVTTQEPPSTVGDQFAVAKTTTETAPKLLAPVVSETPEEIASPAPVVESAKTDPAPVVPASPEASTTRVTIPEAVAQALNVVKAAVEEAVTPRETAPADVPLGAPAMPKAETPEAVTSKPVEEASTPASAPLQTPGQQDAEVAEAVPESEAPVVVLAKAAEAAEQALPEASPPVKLAATPPRRTDASSPGKDAPRVVVVTNAPQETEAAAAEAVTSTAKYVSEPEDLEAADGALSTAVKAPASPKDKPETVSPKSTAKYVSVAEASAEASSDANATKVTGTGERAPGSGAEPSVGTVPAKPEIGPGGVEITPLSKVDPSRRAKTDEVVPATARADSVAAVVPAETKAVQAKSATGKAALESERPTLSTVSEFTVRGVRYLVSNGEKTISVRLVPESLGELRLEVTSNDNSVSVRMVSSNSAVRDALQSQMHGLRETLTRDGFTVAQATVSAQLSSDTASKSFAGRQSPYFSHEAAPGWSGEERSGSSGGQTSPEPRRERNHSGALNLFA